VLHNHYQKGNYKHRCQYFVRIYTFPKKKRKKQQLTDWTESRNDKRATQKKDAQTNNNTNTTMIPNKKKKKAYTHFMDNIFNILKVRKKERDSYCIIMSF
jgi:hypothetical protein